MIGWIACSGAAALGGYTTVAAAAAHRLISPRRQAPLIEPSRFGLAYEDIWFGARGEALTIAAWHLPSPGATRAVIIAHGLNHCRGREFNADSLELVAYLVQHGFTVLTLDLRGHGESDAAPGTFGIRERRDVLGAVDWLLAQGYAPGAIGVLGMSMGGVAAIGAASEESAIGALATDSAFAVFSPMMRAHFRRYSKLPAFFLPGALLVGRMLTGEWLAALRPVDQLDALAGRQLLVIHARGDELVPVEHAHALAQAGNGELWLTDGTRHLGSFAADPHAYNRHVTQFFQHALADKPPAQALPEPDYDTTSDEHMPPLHTRSGKGLQVHWNTTPDGLRIRWKKS